MIEPRPKTLAEIAARTIAGSVFGMELADFLDEFYLEPSRDALAEAPQRMRDHVENGHRKDVYLAAVAEHLGRGYQFESKPWVFADDLTMEYPVFAYQSLAGRAYLLRDSPPAFKNRNLFVTPNVLSRV